MLAIAICDDDSLIGRFASKSADIMLSLGDLGNSTIEKAATIYRPKQTFAVRGNHDSNAPFPVFVTSLHCTIERYGGLAFGGIGGCWRYKPRGHHLFDQHEVSSLLQSFPRVDVFIAHNSPRGIHERDSDVHQGFDAFVDYIDRLHPRYFIHGHQHLGETTQRGNTQIIGIFGEEKLDLVF